MLKSVEDAPYEIRDPIKEFWPPEEWDNAASISFLESGWRWDAEADTTRGGSVPCGTIIATIGGVPITAEHSISYFQLNLCNFQDWETARLWNARQNAGTAHALWADRGWQPWYFSAKTLGLL